MAALRWRRLCLGLMLSLILLYLKYTFSPEDQQRELRKSVEVTRVTETVPAVSQNVIKSEIVPVVSPQDVIKSEIVSVVSPQDVIKTDVYSHSPAAPLKTLHSSNTSFCKDPGSLPSHLEARRLRVRKVCTSLKIQSPLLRRRRLNTYLLTKLRWDILHHILYCPVPQVGLPWTKYMLGSVDEGNTSVTGNNVDVLLGRRLPSPTLEALEAFAFGDGVRVMVARHPFSRLVSAYLTLMKEANKTHTSEFPGRTKGERNTHSQAKIAVPASFREFCRYVIHTIEQWVASPHLPPPDPRWMPVTYLCSPCTVNYTIISKVRLRQEEPPWYSGTMRALGSEGLQGARVRILSTVRVYVGLPHSRQRFPSGNVECFNSDVKFINEYCGLHGEAKDVLNGGRPSLQRPRHTKETHDPAEEDDGAHCMEESKHELLLTAAKKEGRKSHSSSTSNRGMDSSVRTLFSQLSKEEVDRLYRVYQYDFYLLQYRPL
ncbi:Carbohydrate sulfotransferase 11 [Portunus trituberculatus]|uniref:Carbohydrate sulfotransferase n=1 Tax=Portunus trituberculatus TaxID=210409 RepID=A0A5B7DSR3_PORTR|nr:Carbohydrate sulfotransferase 11 [Portunus trituberculatus]